MSPDQLFIVAVLAIIVPGVFSVISTILAIIIGKRLEDYKEHVNSRMSQLMVATADVARSEGRVEGIAAQKEETRTQAEVNPTPVVVTNEEPVEVQVIKPPEKRGT